MSIPKQQNGFAGNKSSVVSQLNEDDTATLLGEDISDGDWFQGCTVHYTQPMIRAASVLKLLLLCDVICSIALWVTGGSEEYFIDSVERYTLLTSVLDIVCISIVRWLVLSGLIIYSEAYALHTLQQQGESKVSSLAVVTAIIISVGNFIFAAVKGGLILNAFLNNKSYQDMHRTYNALVIAFAVFGFMELLATVYYSSRLKNMKKTATKHIINQDGLEVDKEGKVITPKVNLSRLVGLAKPEAKMLGVGTFCLLITSGSGIIAPYFFGQIVDAAQKSMDDLDQKILILFSIYCVYGIAVFFRAWLFELSGMSLVARIRVELFRAIIKQDIEFFDITRTGELTNRLSSDTQVIQNAITVNISMLIRNLILIIGSLTVMFILDPALTGILLAVVPIISLGAVQYGKFMKTLRKRFQDCLADASTVAEECISSIRTVRAFNGEEKSVAGYDKDIQRSYSVAKKLAILQGLFGSLVTITSFGAICLAMWYGGKLVNEGELSVGILTSFLVYTVQIAGCLAVLSSLYGEFMQALGASERMFQIIDKKPKIVPREDHTPQVTFEPFVKFDDVKFTYPSRPDYEVLKGVTLSIEPGKVMALVGPSGGGKSTIVSLIERFYDVNAGEISIGGIPLQNLDPLWFRTKMSLVSQEPSLFACSIKENIAYGTAATDEQVIEAAKQANAHDFIMMFPEGYDTLVGERGVRLSGGQKQRVAIARSLITNPAILLLDEATSALDAESEQLVQEAIDHAMQGRTVVIIAHRLSTVRNASKVVVIEKGVIAEQGTHDELVAQDGVYKRLVLKQLEAGFSQQLSLDSD